MIKFSKLANQLAVAAAGAAMGLAFLNANPAQAQTLPYRYVLDSVEGYTDYTEEEVTVDGVTYDGTFVSGAVNIATNELVEVSGTFTILDGTLGGPVSLEFLREDYREAGRDGLITLVYLPEPLGLDTLPSVISQLPADTQEGLAPVEVVKVPDDSLEAYDVLSIPAQEFAFPEFRDDDGNPTPIIGLGWSATPVPEPSSVLGLLLVGGGLAVKKLAFSKSKKVSVQKVNSVE